MYSRHHVVPVVPPCWIQSQGKGIESIGALSTSGCLGELPTMCPLHGLGMVTPNSWYATRRSVRELHNGLRPCLVGLSSASGCTALHKLHRSPSTLKNSLLVLLWWYLGFIGRVLIKLREEALRVCPATGTAEITGNGQQIVWPRLNGVETRLCI